VGERGHIGDVVDGHDLEVGLALVGGPQYRAADAPESIDGDTSWHGLSFV
jgi:hypothetical protein